MSHQDQEILIATDRKRGFELSTPIAKNAYINKFKKLFPKSKSISLIEVLDTINNKTGFINSFIPYDFEPRTKKPEAIYFYAVVIEHTQRKGINKIISKFENLIESKVEKTSHEYFTEENLKRAIGDVTKFIENSEISYAPKTGINRYFFTDKKNMKSKPTVLCCSAIEFPYAIDCLLGNSSAPILEDEILIKDENSCNELLFGIADLLGFSYAFRIIDFEKHKIYGNKGIDQGLFSPDAVINYNLIENNWDEMTRFIATIHTGHTAASIIIPKLWNRFKEPIFLGLRELGRINQTLFILKYINNVELRQSIEIHLEKSDFHRKMEMKIQKTPGKMEYISHSDRILNDLCMQLIKKCVIAWNYLYLSNMVDTESKDNDELIKIINLGWIPILNHIDMTQ